MNNLLDEVVELLDRAHRYEDYVIGMCPFHAGAYRPNLIVHRDTFYCLSCTKGGTTEWLIDHLKGWGHSQKIVQKVEPFRNPFTRWLRYKTLAKTLKSAHFTLLAHPSQGSYLCKRRIFPKTIKKLGIGWKDDWFTFPIIKNKKIIGAIARRGEGNSSFAKYIVPSGQDPNLLYVPSQKALGRSLSVVLAFGIVSCISLWLCGLASLSTLGGARLDPVALQKIRKPIHIFPDRGEEKGAIALAAKLGWRGCVIRYNWPNGASDPADLFVQGGKELVLKAVGEL